MGYQWDIMVNQWDINGISMVGVSYGSLSFITWWISWLGYPGLSTPINPPELFLADLASHVYGQTGQPRVLHVWSLSEARLSAQGKAQSDIVSPLGPVATGSSWVIMGHVHCVTSSKSISRLGNLCRSWRSSNLWSAHLTRCSCLICS